MKLEGPVGLALGCGAARGLAHFGVIKALAERNIKIDYIAGVSIGAVVGAALAANRVDVLEAAYLSMDRKKIFSLFDLTMMGSGILEGNKVTEFVHNHLEHDDFADLKIPLRIVSTDLLTGKEFVFEEGSLKQAIRASFAVPGVMTPIKVQDKMLVDGGMVNPVPVKTVREMGAKTVIAVDVNHNLLLKKTASFSSKQDRQPPSLTNDVANDVEESLKQNPEERTQKKNISQTVFERYPVQQWLDKLNHKISSIDMPALEKFKKWTEREPMPGMFSVMLASVDIMERQIANLQLERHKADILIEPDVGHYKFLDFDQAEGLIEQGYQAAIKTLDKVSD